MSSIPLGSYTVQVLRGGSTLINHINNNQPTTSSSVPYHYFYGGVNSCSPGNTLGCNMGYTTPGNPANVVNFISKHDSNDNIAHYDNLNFILRKIGKYKITHKTSVFTASDINASTIETYFTDTNGPILGSSTSDILDTPNDVTSIAGSFVYNNIVIDNPIKLKFSFLNIANDLSNKIYVYNNGTNIMLEYLGH